MTLTPPKTYLFGVTDVAIAAAGPLSLIAGAILTLLTVHIGSDSH
ncbi:hypothetical protein [Enemella evansiae]|nr:hypothetical protein [Enemella evansiae]